MESQLWQIELLKKPGLLTSREMQAQVLDNMETRERTWNND